MLLRVERVRALRRVERYQHGTVGRRGAAADIPQEMPGAAVVACPPVTFVGSELS
jgi:hypothetical protein